MRAPKLSIGFPVYNGEKYLRSALDSILQQDYTDFEIIISDNASQDSTGEICRRYAETDNRIRYQRLEVNQGAARNYKIVFEQARGEYFKWAAHDDVCLPGFLRRCVEVLDQAPPSVVLVAPRTEVIDENGNRMTTVIPIERLDTRHPRPHQRLADVLRTAQWAASQFGLFRSDALRKTRLLDPFFGSDYVLLAELALLGEIWEIPETLFQLRFHPGVSTKANKSYSELLSWWDTSQKSQKKSLFPTMRLGVEYARSISRMQLPIGERLLCYSTAFVVWYSKVFRRRARNYTVRLKNYLGIETKTA